MSSSPKVWLLQLFCCTLLLVGGTSVFAQSSPDEDDFLQLLRQELQLQYDSLQQTVQPPYYMAYRVNETAEHRMTANFGKIYCNSTSKKVSLTIEMRVGTPETDNYHYLTHKTLYTKQIPLPTDNNLLLVKKILKKETQEAYQKAVLQSIENNVTAAFLEGEDDIEKFLFIRNDMDGYYEPPLMESHWNDDVWEHSMWYCTLCHQLDLTESSANLVYQTSRKYLVNSENSYFAQNSSSAILTLRVAGLTPENIPEHIERQYFAFLPDQLPDEEVLLSEMDEMRILLSNVLPAEKHVISHCPVLLSPKASSVLIHNLLGHELENHDNSIFREKTGKKVMPETYSVFSDPSLPKIDNNSSGLYTFDDEGVIGRRIVHIDHGELKQLLAARTQQPGAYKANGHARGNNLLPSPRQSNLVLASSKTLNNNQLFNLLMSEVAVQNLEYGIYVDEVEILCDTDDIITIYPTVCYKRSTNPREPEETLRDIVLTGSKQQWISNLTASGDVASCVAMVCHSQGDDLLTSCTSPALLFRNVNVTHRTIAPLPKLLQRFDGEGSVTPMSKSDLLQKSAQFEWDMDVSLLKIGEETAPYYEDFLMTDAQVFAVEASEGSVFYSNEKPVRQFIPRLLLGDNRLNNENITGAAAPPASYPLPTEDRQTFARDFRQAANAEYLKALQQWKIKQTLQDRLKPGTLPDRSEAVATQTFDEHNFAYPTLNNLEHLACDASAALAKHGFLNHSGVNIYIMQGNAYYWSSEKTTYSRPVSVIALQIYGTVELRESEEYVDAKTLFFPCTDSLLSLQRIQNEINAFAQHLQNMKGKIDYFQYYHNGPVLIEGEAVGQFLASSLLETTPNLLAHRDPVITTLPRTKSFENQLDNIITAKKISVTANKSGDKFTHSTFVRSEKTDAEGVETQETEIIRNGELITLMGNRNITESTSYSNGFQQLAIHNEGCFGTRGASRLDFEHKSTVSHKKLKQMLIREAKRQGCRYAYIIRQFYDANMQNIMDKESPYYVQLLQCYRVDVRTGEEIPMVGAKMLNPNFHLLKNILYVSDNQTAFPVMTQIRGASGTRDFPFAGVPTCIVAPDGILLKRVLMED